MDKHLQEEKTENASSAVVTEKREAVLLVEDDRFVSDIYKRKLSGDGYAVTHVENGRDALQCMERAIPDIVLLDVMMPVLNGMETLDAMKKDPRFANVPVIMLTNLGEREYVEKAEAFGVRDYIIKAHYTPSEVIKKIRDVLDGRRDV